MRALKLLILSAFFALSLSGVASAKPRSHEVKSGESLIKIAKEYGVSVKAICYASNINRKKPIKVGQVLTIPSKEDKTGAEARKSREEEAESAKKNKSSGKSKGGASGADASGEKSGASQSNGGQNSGVQSLSVPGAPIAYYHEPTGPGRKSLRPVLIYLHGRGGNPKRDCERWAKVASHLGWVVCPSGPEDRGEGKRGWYNNWAAGHRVVMSTLNALRAEHGRRVQLYGNTIIGFSEGALVAMNVGVREPKAFNRWLILAADTKYWGGPGLEALQKNRRAIRKVYLITGQNDATYEPTLTVKGWLDQRKVPVRSLTPSDMGHELLLENKRSLYQSALTWLNQG